MPLNLLLAGLSALLLILAFPRFDIAALAPFALAPLLVAVARTRARVAGRPVWPSWFLAGWVTGIVYWAGTCYWIQFVLSVHAGMSTPLAWLGFVFFSLYKALHMGLFALLAGFLLRRRWAVLTVPALWVAIERTHGDFGFAWLALGNAGLGMSLPARLAPFTGVYGISFVFAMMGTAAALVALRRPRVELAPVVALLLLPLVPGLPEAQHPAEPAVLVQPNISETARWSPQWVDETRRRFEALTYGAALQSPKSPPRLIVWPEAPFPSYYDRDSDFRTAVNDVARRNRAYLILNVTPYTAGGAPLNSALLISPDGQPLERYDKMNLVPFGEFVPRPFQWLVEKVSSEAGDFAPGQRQALLRAGTHRIGAFICYESVFPDYVRRFAGTGADLLVNLSNDGWYGHTAARDQHLKIVQMRAAENRRWILRATNDGITSTIDPAGRVSRNLPSYVEGAARTGYSYVQDVTFYTRHGDWLVWVCVMLAAAGLVETKLRGRTDPAPGN